jgi:hypothetical protein
MTASQWTAEAKRYEALSDNETNAAASAAYNAAAVTARLNAYTATELEELAASLSR